jgi:magnesium chelatase family protein
VYADRVVVQKYLNKISGAACLDRIDLHVEVTPVSFNELSVQNAKQTDSNTIREKSDSRAETVQAKRFQADGRHALQCANGSAKSAGNLCD